MLVARTPCSFLTYALLGSYLAQSRFGDLDVTSATPGAAWPGEVRGVGGERGVNEDRGGVGEECSPPLTFSPHDSAELRAKVSELHRTHRSATFFAPFTTRVTFW